MRKLKKMISEELKQKTEVNFTFDNSKLKMDEKPLSYNVRVVLKKRVWMIPIAILSIICCLGLCIITLPILARITPKNNYLNSKKRFSLNELRLMESSSLKKIGEVSYPNGERQKYDIDDSYRQAFSEFSNKIFRKLKNDFSPISLFSNLNMISLSANDQETKALFDNLLGLEMFSEEERIDNFQKMYLSDYFCNKEGTIQMYNSTFLTNEYEYNPNFVNQLVDYYSEVYQIDFNNSKDVNQIIKWMEQATDQDGIIDRDDLEIDGYTAALFFSTFYFNSKWETKYYSRKSYFDDFYNMDGSKSRVKYMNHAYSGNSLYVYDDYVCVYDRYKNDLEIKYIIPNGDTKSVLDLLESKDLISRDDLKNGRFKRIDLTVPIFSDKSEVKFNQILKDLGLGKVFNEYGKSLNKAFTNLDENVSVYLKYIKQMNDIAFSESGTIIKSITMSSAGNKSSGYQEEIVEITLNKPFIYVIYDHNKLPIYVGTVNAL